MASILSRCSLFVFRKCFSLINAQTVLTRKIKAPAAFHTARFTTDEFQLHTIRLQKQNLPPYPHIESIRNLEIDTFLPSHYKIVKYDNHEFSESIDGYVQVFIKGYHDTKQFDTMSGYAVFFTENNPLNLYGAVERRQGVKPSLLYAFLKAMHQITKSSFKKVCICIPDLHLITFIDRHLRNISENSFRSLSTGRINKDLITNMEINQMLRMRQDLTLRLKFTPKDIGLDATKKATKLAIKAAEEATKLAKQQRFLELSTRHLK